MPFLTHLDLEALMASHASNHNITPSTLPRRGSQSSLSSSSSTSSCDYTSHNHHLFRSLHLQSLRTHWREHIWTHHTNRSDRIALGNIALGRIVLTTEEMEVEMQKIPEVTRGFMDCLPVAGVGADGVGSFVGWRVKGATFPRTMAV